MEPIEWGLAAIAVLMGKKACETVSESLTKEVFDATFQRLKAETVNLSGVLRGEVGQLGERVRDRFPQEANPFDDPELLEAIVVEETQDPEMDAVVKKVEQQLPPMEIKIDRRKQQGIVINDQGTQINYGKIEQNFS